MLVAYTNSKLISDASDNTQQLGGSWNATQGVISPYEQRRARTVSSDDVASDTIRSICLRSAGSAKGSVTRTEVAP